MFFVVLKKFSFIKVLCCLFSIILGNCLRTERGWLEFLSIYMILVFGFEYTRSVVFTG